MANQEYDNNMRGVLFKNDKEGIETRADYRGHCEIDGAKFFIDAWVNTSKAGAKFMSLRLKRAHVVDIPPSRPQSDLKPATDFNDDIPF